MSDRIEVREVQGGCGGQVYAPYAQPYGQGYYQDWRAAQVRYAPEQYAGAPCGGVSYQPGNPNSGAYWDTSRKNENDNQLQYWGAKRDGDKVIRTASGKVMDADYGSGNWAHSPHDSNSVTVHRHDRTEHWVSQYDGRWYDQINNRYLNRDQVQYDQRTGKLVIEGETYDPNKKPEPEVLPPPEVEPEVLPPPEIEKHKVTRDELLAELKKEPFDLEKLHNQFDGMNGKERLEVLREATRAADIEMAPFKKKVDELEKAKAEGKAVDAQELDKARKALEPYKEISGRAHNLLGRELLPELLKAPKWNTQSVKELLAGMGKQETFNAVIDAAGYADFLTANKKVPADLASMGTPEQMAARARATVGFMSYDLAKEYEAKEKVATDSKEQAKLHKLTGDCKWRTIEWFMSAGHLDPRLYNDASQNDFRQQVLGLGLPGKSAEFILDQGKKNPGWMTPDQAEIAQKGKDKAFVDAYARALEAIRKAMLEPKK